MWAYQESQNNRRVTSPKRSKSPSPSPHLKAALDATYIDQKNESKARDQAMITLGSALLDERFFWNANGPWLDWCIRWSNIRRMCGSNYGSRDFPCCRGCCLGPIRMSHPSAGTSKSLLCLFQRRELPYVGLRIRDQKTTSSLHHRVSVKRRLEADLDWKRDRIW